MRTALIVIILLVALGGILWLLPRDGALPDADQRMDAPWVVDRLPDGNTRVLGIDLGAARFDDAMARFGAPESIALFIDERGDRSLEVYFGDVHLGPMMKTKLVVNLAADPDLLDDFTANAIAREGTREGDTKLLLASEDKARLGPLPIASMTCIPSYRGLEPDFFRERLGPPAAARKETGQAVSWFYPDLGLSLVIDAEGPEVFEYLPPSRFILPDDAAPFAD